MLESKLCFNKIFGNRVNLCLGCCNEGASAILISCHLSLNIKSNKWCSLLLIPIKLSMASSVREGCCQEGYKEENDVHTWCGNRRAGLTYFLMEVHAYTSEFRQRLFSVAEFQNRACEFEHAICRCQYILNASCGAHG